MRWSGQIFMQKSVKQRAGHGIDHVWAKRPFFKAKTSERCDRVRGTLFGRHKEPIQAFIESLDHVRSLLQFMTTDKFTVERH